MLRYLKAQTQVIHNLVEKDNLAKYIVDHTITREQYQELLVQNYSIYSAVEKKIISSKHLASPDLYAFINANKSEILRKDLKQFDAGVENTVNTAAIRIETEAALVGALYVIEGSMLGSLLISKNIGKCIGLKEVQEYYFFNQEATKEVVNRWKNFSEVVGKKEYSEKEKSNASIVAKNVFKLFGKLT